MAKVWLITGSSRGLGFELAKAVLDAGDRLVATARNTDDLKLLAAKYGDRVRTVALDVTKPEEARRAVAIAKEAFGRLDVVVNNAGYADVGAIEDMPEEALRAQIETNLFGVINVTRAALPVLRVQRAGHVIQISSVGGRVASPGLAAYQAAKWAVGGFSEVLAKEVGPLGIRVTVAEPGGMRTDWAGSSMRVLDTHADYDATVGAFMRNVRGRSDGAQSDPAKVARAILAVAEAKDPPLRLLLGSDASFIAGLAAKARTNEDEAWLDTTLSTDADGVARFADLPIAKVLAGDRS